VTTRKGVATRRKILEAAWRLVDAQGAESLLAGVTLREVATKAAMTPSSITYHFPTMRALAVGMVEMLETDETADPQPVAVVDMILDTAEHEGLATAIRLAAAANWEILTSPEELALQHRLNRTVAAALDPEMREGLTRLTDSWVLDLARIYERTAERLGLRPVEPFTHEDLARAVAAMADGLLRHWMCDPDAVRPGLLEDMAVMVTSATMVPAARPTTLSELSAQLPRPGAEDPLPHDLQEAHRLAELFGSGVDGVTLSQLGSVLRCGADEVATRFGTVRRAAALSFHRHLRGVHEAVARRPDAGHGVSLTDGVYELARATLVDPHCALALVHERQRDRLDPPSVDVDVRVLVPVGEVLVPALAEVVDASPSDTADLADLVADTVLSYGATHPRQAITTVTDTALRLVPDRFSTPAR
jgi:AcrR family transcriptional regulator